MKESSISCKTVLETSVVGHFFRKHPGRTAETEAQRKRNGDIHTLVNGATAGKPSPGTGRGGADEPDQTRIRSSR